MPGQAPELIDTGNGLTVRFRGRFLYSPSDPVGAIEKRITGRSYAERTLYILPSPLLFHGMDTLIDRIDETAHVLCLETDQALMALSAPYFSHRFLTDTRISYIRSDSPSAVLSYVRELNPRRFRRSVLLPLTGGYSLDSKRYTRIAEAVSGEISRLWQDTMTKSHMGRRWMRNIFTNLRFHPPTARALPVTGKPVTVAGAGESLEASLPLLRALRNEVWLLAVDTALPVLLTAGIVPDAVCAVEAQQANVYDFLIPSGLDMPGRGKSAEAAGLLLCDLSSYPGAVRAAGCGPVRYFFSSFDRLNVFDRLEAHGLMPPEVPPLGSIGITSLYIASLITLRTVLYTGLDFAYVPGKTHARGAPSHTARLSTADRLTGHTQYPTTALRPWIRAAGREKESVNTDYVLFSYAAKLAELVEEDTRFVDIGGRGVSHPGRAALTEREIRKVIGETEGAGPPPIGAPEPARDRRTGIGEFFRGEYALLERVMDAGRRYLAVDQSPKAARKLRGIFENADYLYFHFPDPPPLPLEDPNFVKRVLLSAEEYTYRIRPLVESLSTRHLS